MTNYQKQLKKWADRRMAIYQRRMAGEPISSIARDKKINLSDNRVRQIVEQVAEELERK